jgi:hypothetical protein
LSSKSALTPTSPNVCNTKWTTVQRIITNKQRQKVYDIEVINQLLEKT